MADEQTPQSDLIDDAIRKAERQLEAKLEALKMSALGETTLHMPDAAPDDVAVLRPTGATSPSGDDGSWSNPPEHAPTAPPASGVSGLTASWDDAPAIEPASPRRQHEPTPAPSPEPPSDPAWNQPEPVHSSWTGDRPAPAEPVQQYGTPAPQVNLVENVPTEEELQFRAQTRTALRNLQQMTETLPSQMIGGVLGDVERVVRDELAAPNTTLRMLQQNVQQAFPQLAERMEAALQDEVAAPTSAIRQVQEELPSQLDRVTRDVTSGIAGEMDRVTGSIQGTITRDVGQLEQSIATNVTRMAQGLGEGVARIERGVTDLDENVSRSERGIRSEFDRVEASLQVSIEQAQGALRDDITKPTETLRKLEDELPARFTRLERTVVEQVDSTRQHLGDQVSATRRDLSEVLVGLVDANRVALDRLAYVTRALDDDRTTRAEDLELIIDTMTTGWEGMAKAVTSLYAQGEEANQRITVLEERLVVASKAMVSMEHHVRELQPAPVMVTVNHPDAQVSQTTRAGYLVDED